MYTDASIRAALNRSDRYLAEVVEALGLCPYARPCREQGRLGRAVTLAAEPSTDELATMLATVLEQASTSPEVVLLICPAVWGDAAAWSDQAEALQAALADRHTGEDGWVVAPFHPQLTGDGSTPGRLVPLLRRTPDPTLQLVHRAALARVHAGAVDDTRWVDPKTLVDTPPESLPSWTPGPSERIAEENHRTVQRLGIETLLRLLGSLRGG